MSDTKNSSPEVAPPRPTIRSAQRPSAKGARLSDGKLPRMGSTSSIGSESGIAPSPASVTPILNPTPTERGLGESYSVITEENDLFETVEVKVTVLEARGLSRAKAFSRVNPKCVITVGLEHQDTFFWTNTSNPKYNQTFTFTHHGPRSSFAIAISFFHVDTTNEMELLGRAYLPCTEDMRGVWVAITNTDKRRNGEVKLDVVFPAQGKAEPEEKTGQSEDKVAVSSTASSKLGDSVSAKAAPSPSLRVSEPKAVTSPGVSEPKAVRSPGVPVPAPKAVTSPGAPAPKQVASAGASEHKTAEQPLPTHVELENENELDIENDEVANGETDEPVVDVKPFHNGNSGPTPNPSKPAFLFAMENHLWNAYFIVLLLTALVYFASRSKILVKVEEKVLSRLEQLHLYGASATIGQNFTFLVKDNTTGLCLLGDKFGACDGWHADWNITSTDSGILLRTLTRWGETKCLNMKNSNKNESSLRLAPCSAKGSEGWELTSGKLKRGEACVVQDKGKKAKTVSCASAYPDPATNGSLSIVVDAPWFSDAHLVLDALESLLR